MTPKKEPPQLKAGKKFHKKIQNEWLGEKELKISTEKRIRKPNKKFGRIDVSWDGDDGSVCVIEIKNSNWDKMTDINVRKNVRRHIRQIWAYVESELKEKDVSPGIIYSRRPSDPNRLKLIEDAFEEEGISVVWDDETIQERKNRA